MILYDSNCTIIIYHMFNCTIYSIIYYHMFFNRTVVNKYIYIYIITILYIYIHRYCICIYIYIYYIYIYVCVSVLCVGWLLSELVHFCPNGTGRGSSEDECGQYIGHHFIHGFIW